MSWPTVLCAATASACLVLAALHFLIWLKIRSARASLGFAVLAVGVAVFAWCSLAMMRADTADRFFAAIWWTNLAAFVAVAGLVGFVSAYFRTARPWLGHLTWLFRFVTVVVNVTRTPSFAYDSITALRPIGFLGETVYVVQGVTSGWFWFGQVTLVLAFVFPLDASYRLWKTGDARERHRAVTVGVAATVFMLVAWIGSALTFREIVAMPHLEFIPFLGLMGAMGYELSLDVIRAAQLTGELQVSEAALRESERRMVMAANAGRLGLWIWDLRANDVWLTTNCRELLDLPGGGSVSGDTFHGRLHPEDRARVEADLRRARSVAGPAVLQHDYRVLTDHGHVRWIAAHARVDRDAAQEPFRIVGVCVDETDQRVAEMSARELSGRLITAQEDERRRLARDLHDDLSQQLSVVSLDLELLGRGAPGERKTEMDRLAHTVRSLAAQVHRMAYQLHPAKLDQLGLETAVRGWCRELAEQSGIAVDFSAETVPAGLPPDISLCLYRIVQESLRNVVRHSGAEAACVELSYDGEAIGLAVSDRGRGFDQRAAGSDRGLGLLSMRDRVQLVGGTFDVASRQGKGTTLTVTIPWRAETVGSFAMDSSDALGA